MIYSFLYMCTSICVDVYKFIHRNSQFFIWEHRGGVAKFSCDQDSVDWSVEPRAF